jgi:pimeloyl-ACP methyl ester carboxylesterase
MSTKSVADAGRGYCPHPLSTDPDRFGLVTSILDTELGPVTVRHGRRTGSGVATILLHGAAGSWTTWTPLIQSADLDAAAPLTDLVIPDLPGWGDTALHHDTDAETIQSLAAAVLHIVTALGYDRWQLLGHSLGGVVALELAASAPSQTCFVGLVSATTFSMIQSVRHPLTRFMVLPAFTALLGVMRVLALFGAAGLRPVRGLQSMGMLRPLVSPLFHRVGRVHPSVIQALAIEARPRSFALAADRAGSYDAGASWERISCAVRSVHGDQDVFVTADDDHRMRAVIEDFTVAVLPGTAHFGHIESPSRTLVALGLRSVGRRDNEADDIRTRAQHRSRRTVAGWSP